MKITKAKSLRDQVSKAVLDLLRTGELPYGSRVTEEALAERFEVSRTPIREALARLAQQGILEKRRQGGFCVPSLTSDEIEDIVAARLLLEPIAMREVTKALADREIRLLEATVKGQDEAISSGKIKKFDEYNEKFRQILFGSISNKYLRSFISQFDAHIHFMRAIAKIDAVSCGPMIGRQYALLEAINKRDPDAAEARWREYLEHTRIWLLQAFQQQS